MSLILDALKRSRQDSSAVPGVDTYHSLEDLSPPWRRYVPWLALLLAGALIAFLLLERAGQLPEDSKLTAAAVTAPNTQPTQAKAPSQVKPQQRPKVSKPTPAPTRNAVPRGSPVALTEPKPKPKPQPVAKVPPPEPVEAEQAAAVAELYRAREQQASTGDAVPQQPAELQSQDREIKEQPVNIEEILQVAREEMDKTELAEHAAPLINSLSQQTKNAIPTILYQRHDYSGRTAQAQVVMNGKTLRVGGSPAAGVKIEEILPGSTVLSFRGTQFRLRALNSWVNL